MLPDQTATGEERRWDQGSLLTIETVNSLVAADVLPSEWKNKGYALVISHPCDLAADTAVEPFVEFVLATPIEQPDGNYRYGKSGRKLHLDAIIGDRTEHFEISIHDHARVNRTELVPPDEQLDKQATQLVARWVSRRYTRSAFPDTFNKRIEGQRPAMRRLLRGKDTTSQGSTSNCFLKKNSTSRRDTKSPLGSRWKWMTTAWKKFESSAKKLPTGWLRCSLQSMGSR